MPKKDWTDQQEQLLITWAEKASGYAWLHQRSAKLFHKRNLYLSLPAAIFSYVAGTTILLSNDVFSDCSHFLNRAWLRGIIGIVALMAGLFSNFQEMYSFKEESAKHRIAKLRFLSFFREISCVITAAPKYRETPGGFITMKRLEFDKILEQSPDIPQSIVIQFKIKFKHLTLHKPDVVVGLQTILPYGKVLKTDKYHKLLSPQNKIILLQYFYAWKELLSGRLRRYNSGDVLVEITNSRDSNPSAIVVEDNNITCSERNREYLLLHGVLSEQKRLLNCQNIKIRRDPLSLQT